MQSGPGSPCKKNLTKDSRWGDPFPQAKSVYVDKKVFPLNGVCTIFALHTARHAA
jgi:hypothetical protein